MGVKKNVLVRSEELWKEYPTGKQVTLQVLRGINVEIEAGEIVVIIGPSGSGKSTLLHLLGALDQPTQGKVYYETQDLSTMSERAITSFRNKTMGFIFQFHHLLPEFSALENVAMPALIRGDGLK